MSADDAGGTGISHNETKRLFETLSRMENKVDRVAVMGERLATVEQKVLTLERVTTCDSDRLTRLEADSAALREVGELKGELTTVITRLAHLEAQELRREGAVLTARTTWALIAGSPGVVALLYQLWG